VVLEPCIECLAAKQYSDARRTFTSFAAAPTRGRRIRVRSAGVAGLSGRQPTEPETRADAMTTPFHSLFRSPLPILLLAATAAAQRAQSTFGHARARQLVELGQLPTARDVVERDLVNYHQHRLPLPAAGRAVALDVRFDRDAVRPGDDVWLQVGYATKSEGDRALGREVVTARASGRQSAKSIGGV
jgi:hypothetical protein